MSTLSTPPIPDNPNLPKPDYGPPITYLMCDAEGNVTSTINIDIYNEWLLNNQNVASTNVEGKGLVQTFLSLPSLGTPPVQWITVFESITNIGSLTWSWNTLAAAQAGHAEVVTYVETQLEV